MAVQPWRKGVVTQIREETHNTKTFCIQVPELSSFDFAAGQFITFDLPIGDKPIQRWRSYSIASWPNNTNEFELLIVLLEGGAGTTYLFNEVKVGTELTFRGPQGVFVLPQIIDKDIFMICTGTGIAPFRSMLHSIKRHALPHQNLYLLFGTRTQNDLLYAAEMQQLEKELDDFYYLPTLSREQWSGCCGYVHSVYENLLLQKKKEETTVPPAFFYLCGWKNMVDEAKHRLLHLGYTKNDIHLELYG